MKKIISLIVVLVILCAVSCCAAADGLTENQVIYSGNDCVITFKGIKDDTVRLFIENNSKSNLKFYLQSHAINGIMSTGRYWYSIASVPSGKKANAKLEFDESFLDEVNIYELRNLSFIFAASEDYRTLFKTRVVIVGEPGVADDQRIWKNVTEESGFSYGYLLLTDDNTLYFTIENLTDNYYTVSIDNISVNDYGFSSHGSLIGEDLHPHAVLVGEIKIDGEFMDDNDIDTIEKVEFAITRQLNDDYKREEKSSVICIDIS